MNDKNDQPTGGKTEIIPVPEWPRNHAWPSVAGLRWLIHQSRVNGFDDVVRRVGRRVLIDEAAFYRWVEKTGRRG